MKIFNLSLQRTATQSYYHFIRDKVKSVHFVEDLSDFSDGEELWKKYKTDYIDKDYVSFADTPIPYFADKLLENYPNAVFICFTRDKTDWIKSVLKLFSIPNKIVPIDQLFYGKFAGITSESDLTADTISLAYDNYFKLLDKHKDKIHFIDLSLPNKVITRRLQAVTKIKFDNSFPTIDFLKKIPQAEYSKDTGVFTEKNALHWPDQPLLEHIKSVMEQFNVQSAYEFGCGNGEYSRYLINNGIDMDVSDGNPHTESITDGLGYTLNLSEKIDKPIRDAVMCLEVGEHIPEKFETIVLDNIANHASKLVILSWAVEGQAGTGHVNCRNNDYIIGKMQERGFDYNQELSQNLRNASTLEWFEHTIMVFFK